ncbi:MAG: HEAT repeat domain-containing protein [Chloracidobacterium sp.]|nr:HEAT repeat domain-containing protein [Chloracidobacterium sp.]
MGSLIENFDSPARLLLEALLNTLWQGTLIAVLVWLLLRFVDRLSATTRHAVWLVTLLSMGVLPLLAVVTNRNEPATSPATPGGHEAPRPAVQTATPTPANHSDHPNHPNQKGDQADPFSLDNVVARLNAQANQGKISLKSNPPSQIQKRNLAQRRSDDGAGVSRRGEPSAPPAVVGTSSLKLEGQSYGRRVKSSFANALSGPAPLALVGLWMAICALMSWRVARSYRAVSRLRGRLEPAQSEHHGHVERLASLFGIKRPVRAFTSEQIVMPMTIGSLKPLIIMPADLAEGLSQSEFESVVAHELAHIKRWDYLTNMLQRVVQSYLFFHPAVWFICRQLTIERELACDDWAVKTCEPRRYASCLTKLVEALNESKPHRLQRVAATGIGGIVFGKHVISRRVEMILKRDRNSTTAVSKPALLYAVGLVIIFVAVCSLISPVIALPLGQSQAKKVKKESKAGAPAESLALPTPPPVPSLPPDAVDVVEPPGIPDVPDIPEASEAPLPPEAQLHPEARLAPGDVFGGVPGGVIGGVPGGVIGGVPGGVAVQPRPGQLLGQGARAIDIAPLALETPQGPAIVRVESGQNDNRAEPAIPESELINLLVDIVKRDSDPNVRAEALQGLCRVRTDAGVNALIQLYDGTSDVKVKGEIIRYLLRREGGSNKVDNSKAIAKLVSIAKSEKNEELRNKAISYLGAVKGDEGADTLIQIYDTLQDQKMKQYVIRSLAQNRGRKAVDKIVQIAKNDSDPVVRQFAIRSLYNVDNQRYLELDRKRIGMIDGQFFNPRPALLNGAGDPLLFEFDAKKWEEWQKDWQKNWEEQSEKMREMFEKLKSDEIWDKLRIEMPKIELQLKDLQDKIKLGYRFDQIGAVEGQLRSQLAAAEARLSAIRAQYADTDQKTVEMRSLRDALEDQLNSVRSMRGPIRRATPTPAPAAAPKVVTSSSL